MPVSIYLAADNPGSLPLSSDRGQENDSDMRERNNGNCQRGCHLFGKASLYPMPEIAIGMV